MPIFFTVRSYQILLPKVLKMVIKDPFVAPNWWISVDQGWIRAGHIQGGVLGPFPGSQVAIGGRHRAPKWPKMAINDLFVASLEIRPSLPRRFERCCLREGAQFFSSFLERP